MKVSSLIRERRDLMVDFIGNRMGKIKLIGLANWITSYICRTKKIREITVLHPFLAKLILLKINVCSKKMIIDLSTIMLEVQSFMEIFTELYKRYNQRFWIIIFQTVIDL